MLMDSQINTPDKMRDYIKANWLPFFKEMRETSFPAQEMASIMRQKKK